MTSNLFFEKPILNSPYAYPAQHWELDGNGQPTQQIVANRRRAEFITPIPQPRKRKGLSKQEALVFDEGKGLSTQAQQYDHQAVINAVRREVDKWRMLPNAADWRVTPETARLLQHWRHHDFSGVRPFFCQIEAVETAIWLTEVAPQLGKAGRTFLDHLDDANQAANPGLARLALKLATGAGKTTVMAMLIAWQTVNAVRRPTSRRFTRGFLLVAPGLTIRDRLNLVHTGDVRPSQVVYELTSHLLLTRFRDGDGQPQLHLFGQLKRIARQWLESYLDGKGGTYAAQLKYKTLADDACERINAGITRAFLGQRPIQAVLDPYNPVGSTRHVSFNTSKTERWDTGFGEKGPRCHLNWVILDSDWEAEFCRVAESHPRVRAYVKNPGPGSALPQGRPAAPLPARLHRAGGRRPRRR